MDDLTRELLSRSRLGMVFTPQHRENISRAKRRSWQDGKYDHLRTSTPEKRHAKGRHSSCDPSWCQRAKEINV